MNDYLYDVDEAQYSFVRVPKLLLQHEAYQRISSEAKLLYSLLLDRVGLSHKNGWRDKQNRIYIIYPIAEIMEEMNCGTSDIHEMTSLLRRCSNNLNQIAKKANATGSIYGADIAELQAKQDEIWEIAKEILARLSSIQ